MVASNDAFGRFVSALRAAGSTVKVRGEKATGQCPCHDDRRPSLSIARGNDGRVLVKCHAGCKVEDIIASLGLQMSDLFQEPLATPAITNGGPLKWKRSFTSLDQAIAHVEQSMQCELAGRWRYPQPREDDEFWIARFQLRDGKKQYRPYSAKNGVWRIKDPKGPLPLYGSDRISGRVVVVCEGEACVDLFREYGIDAVTSAHGAAAARKSDWSTVAHHTIVTSGDNDDAGLGYVRAAQICLRELNSGIAIGDLQLPDLPVGGDVIDWKIAGGTPEELSKLVKTAAQRSKRQRRRSILTNDRQLHEITCESAKAVLEGNDPPQLFSQNGRLVMIQPLGSGRARLAEVSPTLMRNRMSDCADFCQKTRSGIKSVFPPLPVAKDLLESDHVLAFPQITGLTECPVIRPDGTILTSKGFDEQTGLYYSPPIGFDAPSIPEHPTRVDAAEAARYVLGELLVDFPFVDDESRANMFATILTPIVRPVISGSTPLCLIDAPQPGNGKSLLAQAVAVIATGREAGLFTMSSSEEEMRKQITSSLLAGTQLIIIDNLVEPLRSPSLAAVLTSEVWSNRVLGVSRNADVRVVQTWIATGNNIRVEGDLPRRCFLVRVDAKQSEPWKRSQFRHPRLLQWILANRAKVLSALLTIARAWFAEGKPKCEQVLGSFESWCETIWWYVEHRWNRGVSRQH